MRPLLAVLLALALTALLIVAAGKNPLLAYAALGRGALGSWDRVGVGLNKATPYVLTGVGVALCFRARVVVKDATNPDIHVKRGHRSGHSH